MHELRDFDAWKLPGCGVGCFPRNHSPQAHEAYGRRIGRAEQIRLHTKPLIRTGPLAVDLDRRLVTVHDTPVHLPYREEELLLYLARRIGHRIPESEILRSLWVDHEGLPVVSSQSRACATCRYRLRKMLVEAGRLIVNQRNKTTSIIMLVQEEPV